MQREHPSRVRRAPPDRDYDNLTTKHARLEPQDGTNPEQLSGIGPTSTQTQKLAAPKHKPATPMSVSKPTLAPRKKHSPVPINPKLKKPGMLADSARPKTMEMLSAESQESEAKDTPTEVVDESAPEDLTDVDEKEDLEEETAEKELG